MKSKITLLIILLFTIASFSQSDGNAYRLLQDKSQTKILYDRVFNLSNATQISGKTITASDFNQVYSEMQRADFLNRLPEYNFLKQQATLGLANNYIPLSILITDFETIKPTALDAKKIVLNANNQYEVKSNNNVFDLHSINIIAPITAISKTNTVNFMLTNELVFNITNKSIKTIEADFNNGQGFKTINYNQKIKVSFAQAGLQNINFKITFTNGEVIHQLAKFETQNKSIAKNRAKSFSPNVVTTISSTIPYLGYGETSAGSTGFLGDAEYEIFLDTTNGILDKPIFLLDGFDPGDGRDIPAIYGLMNYGTGTQNLADDIRAQGFDVIIVNFPTYTRAGTSTVIDGGTDYIQRNAMILVELINQINLVKVGTQKNVVVGPSMGGLISRYALRYMEMNSLNHDTRLYISFDAPHKGANVPIGFQHLFNYMAYGPLGNTAVQPIVDGFFKSAAGREMLIDQLEGHLQTGSNFEFNTTPASALLPIGCPNFRTAFQTELNTMGFPTTTRNISISNGAGNGTMTGTPDFEVMNHTFNISPTQRAIINTRFTPAANATNQVSRFRGQGQVFGFWVTAYESLANSKAPTFTAGLDSAPGGKFDISSIAAAAGTNPLLTEFFDNLLIQYFDFIPTWSSMSVSGSNNLYTPITATTTTPFAASSIPTINENHITLNPQNVLFAYNEIVNPVLETAQFSTSDLYIQNPVGNNIEIVSNKIIEDATISLVDVSGKVIFLKENQTIQSTYSVPVTIASGIYLLNIKNSNGNITKKLIKE